MKSEIEKLIGIKKSYEEQVRINQRKSNQVDNMIIELLEKHLSISKDSIELGYHECEGSPTGSCFYNFIEDPCCDDCLICHNPLERK